MAHLRVWGRFKDSTRAKAQRNVVAEAGLSIEGGQSARYWNARSGGDLQFRALFERPESRAKLP
jgi:hypothetical protein